MVEGLALECPLCCGSVAIYYDGYEGKMKFLDGNCCEICITPPACNGCGAPTGTPDYIGQIYVDTQNTKIYKAASVFAGGWITLL